MKQLNIKYSQNYFYDEKFVEKIVGKCNLDSDDVVIEIGAGKGIITKVLAKSCKKVIAIELDSKNIKVLNELTKEYPNIKVVYGDFLKYKILEEEYKIVSNIPYQITSKIINKILETNLHFKECCLILQKEAALKYASITKPSIKNLLYMPKYEFKVLMEINRNQFIPKPNVDSYMLSITKKEKCDFIDSVYNKFKDFVCFLFKYHHKNLSCIFTYRQIKAINKTILNHKNIFDEGYQVWKKVFDTYQKYTSSEIKAQIDGEYSRYIQENETKEKIYRTRKY